MRHGGGGKRRPGRAAGPDRPLQLASPATWRYHAWSGPRRDLPAALERVLAATARSRSESRRPVATHRRGLKPDAREALNGCPKRS
jgi:hypothetical protein